MSCDPPPSRAQRQMPCDQAIISAKNALVTARRIPSSSPHFSRHGLIWQRRFGGSVMAMKDGGAGRRGGRDVGVGFSSGPVGDAAVLARRSFACQTGASRARAASARRRAAWPQCSGGWAGRGHGDLDAADADPHQRADLEELETDRAAGGLGELGMARRCGARRRPAHRPSRRTTAATGWPASSRPRCGRRTGRAGIP